MINYHASKTEMIQQVQQQPRPSIMASKNDNNNSWKPVKDQALNGLGSLIKLLPTGTVFLFQFLSPILSNTGHCQPVNKYLMGVLLVFCGLSCAFATFTDSQIDDERNVHYGIATFNGLWRSSGSKSKEDYVMDMSKFRISVADFVHAIMSLVVFFVVAVLDPDTLECFAPSWERDESIRQTMLMVLPPVVGAICTAVFAVFPSKRNGVGYPSNNS